MLPPAHKKKESTETAAACDIARLSEDVLSAAISRTTPLDACSAAKVSQSFRAAADSDAVWSTFLPRDLPPLADGEISPVPPPKKKLFRQLTEGLMSMWTDRETGAICYMLSARALQIVWGDTPQYWRWIPLTDSRGKQAVVGTSFSPRGGDIEQGFAGADPARPPKTPKTTN